MQSWDTLPLEQSLAGAVQRRLIGPHGEWAAADETAEAVGSAVRDLHAPCRWGLSDEATATVGARLYEFWLRFHDCFTTRTRDTSPNAYNSLRGQLTRDNERNFANMARNMTGDDGQALQHFMANSPWSGPAVCGQIQAEIKATRSMNRVGVTPALGDDQARQLLEAPPEKTRKGKRDRAILATLLYHGLLCE